MTQEQDFSPVALAIVGAGNRARIRKALSHAQGRLLGLAEYARLLGAEGVEPDLHAATWLLCDSLNSLAGELEGIEHEFATAGLDQ